MVLLEELKKINNLNSKTKLKVMCTNGVTLEGIYYAYTSELDNEPEEAQLDIRSSVNNGLIGILESEIKSIEVL